MGCQEVMGRGDLCSEAVVPYSLKEISEPLCRPWQRGLEMLRDQRPTRGLGSKKISAEFEDLPIRGKWLESTDCTDVSLMPIKARRDARELRGHCGGSDKTTHSSNISKS